MTLFPRSFVFPICAGLLCLDVASAQISADTAAAWSGGNGNWSDGTQWSTNPQFPENAFQSYSVSIDAGNVTLDRDINIDSLTLGSLSNGGLPTLDLGSGSLAVTNVTFTRGVILGGGNLSVNGPLFWSSMYMQGEGVVNALGGVLFVDNQPAPIGFGQLYGTLNCFGNSSVQIQSSYSENLEFGSQAQLNIMPGATFYGSRLTISGSDVFGIVNGVVANHGSVVIDDAGLNRGMYVFGTAFVNAGSLVISNSTLDVRSTADRPAFIQNSGRISLTNGTLAISGVALLNAGTLTGNGIITNIQSDATIAPTAAGFDFQQTPLTLLSNSVLIYDIQGFRSGVSCSRIVNVGTATLGGTLRITISGSAQKHIRPFTTLTILQANAIVGQFTNVLNGQRLLTADGRGSFLLTCDGAIVRLSNFKRHKAGGRL
jgi:hypothetical protein